MKSSILGMKLLDVEMEMNSQSHRITPISSSSKSDDLSSSEYSESEYQSWILFREALPVAAHPDTRLWKGLELHSPSGTRAFVVLLSLSDNGQKFSAVLFEPEAKTDQRAGLHGKCRTHMSSHLFNFKFFACDDWRGFSLCSFVLFLGSQSSTSMLDFILKLCSVEYSLRCVF